MNKRPTFKHGKIKLEKCSPISCYLTINDTIFYLEISSATENEPYISSWHKWADQDDVTEYEPVKKTKRGKK